MPELAKMFDLSGRVAVVTGGAGLLGQQFCRTLAEAGAAAVVVDLAQETVDKVAGDIQKAGGNAIGAAVDITSQAATQALVKKTLDEYGRLDILVNSAALDPKFDPEKIGQQGANAFENYPLESWQAALDVNLTGLFLCTQAAVAPMLKQGKGVIINICSTYGISAPDQRLYQREGQPPMFKPVTYTTTKAGLLGFTKYLAAYYAGKNIRVNALTPGGVFNNHDDEFVQRYSARTIMGRMAEKDEMNGALLFLASDASKYMTGANLVVDGGWTAW
jgi:NAD(P)-dependent dehydrogenase (short-subunit alcohol dehydrogenase family)